MLPYSKPHPENAVSKSGGPFHQAKRIAHTAIVRDHCVGLILALAHSIRSVYDVP
jgi:hypothetical protein